MILPSLGKLCVDQTIASAQTDDSDNVIKIAAVDYAAMTDVWLVIDTSAVATGDGSDTYAFELVLSQESTLDTNKQVIKRTVTGFEDKSLVKIGRHIIAINLGKMLKDMLEADGSDYPFIGLIIAVSSGGEIAIDAALTFVEPDTSKHRMQVESNISNDIAVASAGSGV